MLKIGLEHEVEKLIGSQANTLSNVLTLSYDMHQAFDHFSIWFEEVPGQVRFTYFLIFSSRMTRRSDPRKLPHEVCLRETSSTPELTKKY